MTVPTTIYTNVIAGLRGVGYGPELIAEDYSFKDWFSPGDKNISVDAAAFGETPVSCDSACIGVVSANGYSGTALIDRCRSLGAPFILEIANNEVKEWAVSVVQGKHVLIATYPAENIVQLFIARASYWKPAELLRAKNIARFDWIQQRGLFDGLMPELEEHIQEKLDPILRKTLSETKRAYEDSTGRAANSSQLFKLTFWLLTAKVFRDRGLSKFASLEQSPDELIAAVAEHYGETMPHHLMTREVRAVAARQISSTLDFRNLSVEVLSQIWSTTLVDRELREQLGIYRTPRTIVRYIIDRIPFEQAGDDKRIILEPCSGSAVFLIGAMNKLRPQLYGTTPMERHKYFVERLVGIEHDPFGVEISRLALTLADFPNPNGWKITQGDVFEQGTLEGPLGRAGVVLCNPPFRAMTKEERKGYNVYSPNKPAELLTRVLDSMHPRGVIGFVLPRAFADGRQYSRVRERLAGRFANIDVTVLPDKFFEGADPEVALLVATEPIPHDRSRITFRRVNDEPAARKQFEFSHAVSSERLADLSVAHARKTVAIPELASVWTALVDHQILKEVTTIHRGIEWKRPLTVDGTETGARADLVRGTNAPEFRVGVGPQTDFHMFEVPRMSFLSFRKQDMRGNAHNHPWGRPKAILNKTTHSRGHWRIAAFPDDVGVACYQTYIAVWPKTESYDQTILAAILNSPIANAFVSTREGKIDVTIETLKEIPIPVFDDSQRGGLKKLIAKYQTMLSTPGVQDNQLERLLMEIDAAVLDGYRLPPRAERILLDFFNGHDRPVNHAFGRYVPDECDFSFSLSRFLLPNFGGATADQLLRKIGS